MLKNNSDLGFEVSYRIGQLGLREVNTRQGSYDELSIAGYSFTNAVGEPKLPMQRQLIAVPLGAEVRYSILSSTTRDLDAKDSQLFGCFSLRICQPQFRHHSRFLHDHRHSGQPGIQRHGWFL